MTSELTTPLSSSEEKGSLAFRRLLLAKQLYLHGVDHSNKSGALNKMIAVHNFHNAIEIVLRAILLHYEIRTDKELNIVFEVMLKEINNYSPFREKNVRLPYRQQLIILNQQRNYVQHHAVEPESSMMEEWRVFTRRFLEQVLESHFGLDFSSLSPIDMVENEILQEVLRESFLGIKENNLEKSMILSREAFEFAAGALSKFLPEQQLSRLFTTSAHQFGNSKALFKQVLDMSYGAMYFAALLWSGISPLDYKRYKSCTASAEIHFSESGQPEVIWLNTVPDEKSIRWLHDFVANTIVHWQTLGFALSISEWSKTALRNLIKIF